MTHVDVQEAKTRLSQLLGGRPVVRLVSVDEPAPRPVGFVAGRVPESFSEPLPDDELARWE
jgi:antitoxin (DNA-binding transcriptional repressor) of toxin-antitoxin stability system